MPVFEDPSNQALLAKLQELGNINLTGGAHTIDAHSMQLAVACSITTPTQASNGAAAGAHAAGLTHINKGIAKVHEFVFDPATQHLTAASSAGTSLVANLKHITVTLATWDERLRLYGAQDRALEQFFKKLEEEMAEASMKRHGHAKQLVVFFAKRSKRTEAEQAAEPTQPTEGKGEAKGKAAKAKPAPQPGRGQAIV
ncbi:hypothetical protein HaLaN_23025 [Haematococcus lacustris]|uniref:Uncharacterized protein n=1 Tax=Haematococcus lacustris TaxID=44745 RepID=A0A699ZR02_HAELA|nr:hypothetical protein HaLaN_23025 [Haematococcus lacustris]